MRDGLARTGLVITLLVALVAIAVGAWEGVRLRADVRALSGELTDVRAELVALRRETTELTARADAGSAALDGSGLEGLLDGLLGGGARGLGDLLEGLLDGDLGAGGLAGALSGGASLSGLEGFDPTACLPSPGLDVTPVIAATLDEQFAEVTAAVAAIRELPAEDVDSEVLDGDEVAAEIDRILTDEYPAAEADADARTLTMLGALEPGTDLVEVQRDLLSGQVAGFYDSETRAIVIRDEDGALDGDGISALAHELTHALADAALGLDVDQAGSADAISARSALVEGDAVLAQLHFGLLAADPLSLLQGGDPVEDAEAQAALDDAPPFVAEQLTYPYTYGLAFICGVYSDGGWDAVDALYEDGPVTTAQILFPERLGQPVATPTVTGSPGTGWRELRTDVLGAFDLLALMAAPGGDRAAALDEPSERAAAWGGSTSVLWSRGEESALGVALTDSGEGIALCDTLEAYARAAFPEAEVRAGAGAGGAAMVAEGPDQSTVLRCDGDLVRLGIAPDLDVARAVAADA